MRVAISPDPMALAEILEADVELVEVTAAVPEAVRAFADRVVGGRHLGGTARWVCEDDDRPGGEASWLPERLGALQDVEGHEVFCRWVEPWIDGFACLNGVTTVGVRLVHLRQPMCPRFHVDRIPSRLIVALTGPGTEWIPAPAVRWADGRSLAPSQDGEAVCRVAPGSIALFKGAGFDDGAAPGVVHRSPPGAAERLVLTLDAIA